MKKILLATSALVATMAVAPQAGAQQVSTKAPFEVSLDGWASVYMGAVPTEQNNANQKAYDLKDDFHLIFDAHSKADNGLLYGIFLRTDMDTQKATLRNSDRANIYFQGDWGRVEAGDNQPPGYKFSHLKVISADYSQQAGDGFGLSNWNSGAGPLEASFLKGSPTGTNAINVTGTTDLSAAIGNLGYMGDTPVNGSNASKVLYMTPVIEGFQAAVSYSPDGTNRGGQIVNRVDTAGGVNPITTGTLAGLGSYSDLVEAALSYTKSYDVGFGPVGVYAVIANAYAKAKGLGVQQTATSRGLTDLASEYGGLRLDYAGFKAAFALTYDGHSRLARGIGHRSDGTGYAFGLEYQVGPWTIGGYHHEARSAGAIGSRNATVVGGVTTVNAIGVDQGDYLQDQELGLSYQLAPGILLDMVGYNYDYHDDGAILTTGTKHRDGQVYISGASITF